ncbi:MAG: hypothetical protein DRI57_05450 [Deltaproteobacteria bacterium]|nr:MAG: hypothetical protein DRI57_05450 [Deltaproteobacteria bacterium]
MLSQKLLKKPSFARIWHQAENLNPKNTLSVPAVEIFARSPALVCYDAGSGASETGFPSVRLSSHRSPVLGNQDNSCRKSGTKSGGFPDKTDNDSKSLLALQLV